MKLLSYEFFAKILCEHKSESGATLVEYGIALIVAILVGGSGLSVLADNSQVNMGEACAALSADGQTGATYSC